MVNVPSRRVFFLSFRARFCERAFPLFSCLVRGGANPDPRADGKVFGVRKEEGVCSGKVLLHAFQATRAAFCCAVRDSPTSGAPPRSVGGAPTEMATQASPAKKGGNDRVCG